MTVLSAEAEARRLPSEEIDTASTGSLWPKRVRYCLKVSTKSTWLG